MKSQMLKMKRISSIVKIGTMLTLFASVMMVFLTAAGEENANGWTPPQTIVSSLPTSGWDFDEVMNDIAKDSDGHWHVVYSYVVYVPGPPEQELTYIKYVSEVGDTATLAQGILSSGPRDAVYGPSIVIDDSGTIHVTYVHYDEDTDECSIKYTKKSPGDIF